MWPAASPSMPCCRACWLGGKSAGWLNPAIKCLSPEEPFNKRRNNVVLCCGEHIMAFCLTGTERGKCATRGEQWWSHGFPRSCVLLCWTLLSEVGCWCVQHLGFNPKPYSILVKSLGWFHEKPRLWIPRLCWTPHRAVLGVVTRQRCVFTLPLSQHHVSVVCCYLIWRWHREVWAPKETY